MNRFHQTKHLRAATLVDVSREAGVSPTAVSLVMNQGSAAPVSEGTRKRILAAAKRLAYRPNLVARGLVQQRLHTLGVATEAYAGEFSPGFLDVLNGILTAANDERQSTSIFSLRDWEGDTERLRRFCDGRIDGLILVSPSAALSPGRLPDHFPIVAVNPARHLAGMANVECDEEAGACALVRHLLAVGHRRILYLAGPPGHLSSGRRFRGYLRALTAARLPFEEALVASTGLTPELGRAATKKWLRRHRGHPPEAIFCVSDLVAVGCIEALTEAGLRVPEDVSVAGFGDTSVARSTVPTLTSVAWPLAEMGRRAVELLLTRIKHPREEKEEGPTSVACDAEVVRRASVAGRTRTEPAGRRRLR